MTDDSLAEARYQNFGHEETVAAGIEEVTQVSNAGEHMFVAQDTVHGRDNPTIISLTDEQAEFVVESLEEILNGE